jgi:hypothetical protein
VGIPPAGGPVTIQPHIDERIVDGVGRTLQGLLDDLCYESVKVILPTVDAQTAEIEHPSSVKIDRNISQSHSSSEKQYVARNARIASRDPGA